MLGDPSGRAQDLPPLDDVDSALVVVAALQDHEVVIIDEVDQPVFFIDPTRPAPRKDVAERLGLSNS